MATKSKTITKQFLTRHEVDGVAMSLTSNTLKAEETYIGYGSENGSTGQRAPGIEARTKVMHDVKGDLVGDLTWTAAKKFIGLMFAGSAPVSASAPAGWTATTLAEDPTSFADNGFVVKKDLVNSGFTYAGCLANTLKVESSNSEAVHWTLSCLGQTETGGGGAIADATVESIVNNSMVTVSIGSDTWFPSSWSIEVSNNLDDAAKSFSPGSTTRQVVGAGELSATVSLTLDYNSDVATLLGGKNSGTAVSFTWTAVSGDDGVGIYIPEMEVTGDTPDASNSGDIEAAINLILGFSGDPDESYEAVIGLVQSAA